MENLNSREQNASYLNSFRRRTIGLIAVVGAFALPTATLSERGGDQPLADNVTGATKPALPQAEKPKPTDAEQEIADYSSKLIGEFSLEKKQQFSVGNVMDIEVYASDEQSIDETSINDKFESLVKVGRKIDSGKLKVPISLEAYGKDLKSFARNVESTEEVDESEQGKYSVNVFLLPPGYCANFNGEITTSCYNDDSGQTFYPEKTGAQSPDEFLMVIGQDGSPQTSQEAVEKELPNIPLAAGETGGEDPALNDLASEHFGSLADKQP